MSKKNKLDQYYTKPEVAAWCFDRLLWQVRDYSTTFVEPSAGEGVFLKQEYDFEAYDLDPKHEDVVKKDFLSLPKESLKGKVIVGNPPFGWASSLAVKFINHCSEADMIGFILPKTFKKKLFQEKNINKKLHLVSEWDLPKNSFVLEGEPYDVPCCFQIWKREDYERKSLSINEYVVESDFGDKFLRRVGGRAGKFVSEEDYTPSTTYKVKCDEEISSLIEEIYDKIKKEASNTAGVRSITLDEINYILTQELL